MLARLRRLEISPERYRQIADLALISLTLIVFTGAAVRLTGSGLGCPDWPKCGDRIVAPLELHAWIEYGNRLITGIVGAACMAAGLLAFKRRPFRRDLAIVGLLLPLGVLSQAILGGFTVKHELAPGFVMGHFLLSMLCLAAAAALSWLARKEPEERPRTSDLLLVWPVRALLPLAGFVVVLGTITTAAGPHPGSSGSEEPVPVHRLDFRGTETLTWMYHQHGRAGTLLFLSTLAVLLVLKRRGAGRDRVRPVLTLAGLIALQGIVGLTQWQLSLPAWLVWIHVAIATLIWLTALWSVAAAGRLVPAPARAREASPAAAS